MLKQKITEEMVLDALFMNGDRGKFVSLFNQYEGRAGKNASSFNVHLVYGQQVHVFQPNFQLIFW